MNKINIDFEKEYIHGDKFRVVADVVISADKPFDKTVIANISNQNAVIFSDGNYIFEIFDELKNCKGKYIFVTHNGDYNITDSYFNRIPNNIVKWYGQNMCVNTSITYGLPIGLSRPRWDYAFDHHLIGQYMNKQQMTNKIALLNHTTHTNYAERLPCEAWFKDKIWCTNLPILKDTMERIPMEQCIRNMCSHKFMISPPGNGIDCHRTWESIYLGIIPIVKRSIALSYFSSLPILFIDQWNECTQDYLTKMWIEMNMKSYNYEMSTISYWLNRINEDKKQLL